MVKGQDYTDSYSPVVGWPTVRACLLLAASLDLETRSVDFINAFCQAEQKTPLFIEVPPHYKVQGREHEDLVLSLKKSLYGTVTAPKLFYEHIKAGLIDQGFEACDSDPCLFINKKEGIMVLQYVDDQIWICKDSDKIDAKVAALKEAGYLLTIEDDTDMFGFLGIDVKRDNGSIEMTQTGLTDKVIRYTGLEDS